MDTILSSSLWISYLNVHLTVFSSEARETVTLVARHSVQTGPVIEAGGGKALVHVDLRQVEGDQIITSLLLSTIECLVLSLLTWHLSPEYPGGQEQL